MNMHADDGQGVSAIGDASPHRRWPLVVRHDGALGLERDAGDERHRARPAFRAFDLVGVERLENLQERALRWTDFDQDSDIRLGFAEQGMNLVDIADLVPGIERHDAQR